MFVMKRAGVKTIDGQAAIEKKPRTPATGGAGSSSARAGAYGTCPHGVAQLGEGRLTALFTLGGVVIGTLLFKKFGAKVERFLSRKPRLERPRAGAESAR